MEKLNQFENINRLTNKHNFQPNENKINERAINHAKENAINTIGQFNCELRQLIDASIYENSKTPSAQYYASPDVAKIMERVFYIPNCKNNVSVPYISPDSAHWRPEGIPSSDPNNTISSRKLTPHRLCTQITLSKALLNCTSEQVEQKIKDALVNAIYEKLIFSIFSAQNNPDGLYYGIK